MTENGNLLPLERTLKHLCVNRREEFPVHGDDYWARYTALTNYLRKEIYPHINAGLACLSKSPGIYTEHGSQHFDEVVRYAGYLLDEKLWEGPKNPIQSYDLYLLLSAIRLHDAGNIDGREEHERRAYAIMKGAGKGVCSDDTEAILISSIAEAHGGQTETGDKDKIALLPESDGVGPIKCWPRSVAGLVRISDEICEHKNRASSHHVEKGTLPPQNKLFHYYASSIKQARIERSEKAFRLELSFDEDHLLDRYETPNHKPEKADLKYLWHDALDRVHKLDLERIYCNRFLDNLFRIEQIFLKVSIIRTTFIGATPIKKALYTRELIIRESGYPSKSESWKRELGDMCGDNLVRAYPRGNGR